MITSTHVVGYVLTNCYIVRDEGTGKSCVIDPGDFTDEMREQIETIGRENIEYILLTHGHFDHMLGAAELKRLTGAKIAIHELDAEILEDPRKNAMSFFMLDKGVLPRADVLLREGDTLCVGDLTFTLMHTPGHTAGSSCFIVEDRIFSGDTLFLEGCGRTDLPTGDRAEIKKSLKRLAAMKGDYVVYPGHDIPTSLEHERKHNPDM